MNWKFHRSYGGFALGLGAITLALAACSMYDLSATPGEGCAGAGAGASSICETTGNFGGAGSTSSGSGVGAGGTGQPGGNGEGGMGNFGPGSDAGDQNMDGGVPPDGESPAPPDDASTFNPSAACAAMNKDPKILYVSADDSNSMGSPAYAREYLNLGFEPSPARIRTYEFLNYYRISYAPPTSGKLALFAEMEKTEQPTIADFQFALRSYDATARRPNNFTFLIDTSGSMKGPGILRAKDAVTAIASQFINGDTVSIVTTDAVPTKLDGHTIVANDTKITEILDSLTTGGTTDLLTAVTNAYDIEKKHQKSDRMNRVIVISDGGVNVGITDPDIIKKQSADAQSEGIYLVGIGTGPALTYNDRFMNELTDAGRGAYLYINSTEEANRMLAERFDETMDIAARSVQVKLTLPWYFEVEAVSTEKTSTTKLEPQHLAPSDAMVFFLKTTVCDSSAYDLADPVHIRVSWNTPDTFTPQVTELTVPLKDLFVEKSPTMVKGRAIVAYAEALKQCGFDKEGYSLCDSETERRKTTKEKLLLAQTLATEAKNGMPDPELDEILQIIANHPLIKP